MKTLPLLCLLVCLAALVACAKETPPDDQAEPTAPIATLAPAPTATRNRPATAGDIDFLTVAVDAPDSSGEFIAFDAYGAAVGFDVDVMQAVAELTGIQYEFVFTPYAGMLAQVANGVFDLAVARLEPDRDTAPGIVYTTPYLELEQVLVVLANEEAIASYRDLQPEMLVGYVLGAAGQRIVAQLGLPSEGLLAYADAAAALQGLRDGAVRAVVIDGPDARHFTDEYYQQFKIAGLGTADEVVGRSSYAIAVAADNPVLLSLLNQSLARLQESGRVEDLARRWLVTDRRISAGESLIGTPADRLVLGLVRAAPLNMDPAAPGYAFQDWEIKSNIMSGLYRYDETGTLAPALASGSPQVSADGRQYTIPLRQGLTFPDGSELTANFVKAALDRASANGLWVINGFVDSVEVVDTYTVRFNLNDVYGYFASLLTTPPYFVIGNFQCAAVEYAPPTTCAGIGPYRVLEWDPDVTLRLEANPQWAAISGAAPVFSKVELRFYPDSAAMRASLENGAIDLAWDGLTWADAQALQATPGYRLWTGNGIFKSYLVFEHKTPPWNIPQVRQAAAYAVDREALANSVFGGSRQPLYSPIAEGNPAQLAAEPARDLAQAVALLNEVGFSAEIPLSIDLWFINDGRYTPLEGNYAQALKQQLEETGIFRVTLHGEAWDNFRGPMSACELPAFLLGWPPPNDLRYPEPVSWLNYFVINTANVCSNYENPVMDSLLTTLQTQTDGNARRDTYRQIQGVWAQDYPTLDLTQSFAFGVSLDKVDNAQTDLLGFLRYDRLTKGAP